MLDGMSPTKLNVMHWHLSDTTSFPRHIDEIWQCFYSASPDDGVEDKLAAWNKSLVLGGEACIWCALQLQQNHTPCDFFGKLNVRVVELLYIVIQG